MLADALLRSVAGSTAQLRVTACGAGTNSCELGLAPTSFADVVVSPAVMRRLRATSNGDQGSQWELLISAASVAQQVSTLQVSSAQALFAMTLAVTVAGQEYLLESVSANEVFGQVYLYRLGLRKTGTQAV